EVGAAFDVEEVELAHESAAGESAPHAEHAEATVAPPAEARELDRAERLEARPTSHDDASVAPSHTLLELDLHRVPSGDDPLDPASRAGDLACEVEGPGRDRELEAVGASARSQEDERVALDRDALVHVDRRLDRGLEPERERDSRGELAVRDLEMLARDARAALVPFGPRDEPARPSGPIAELADALDHS